MKIKFAKNYIKDIIKNYINILLPIVSMPFAKALSANGEMNVSSKDKLRAIHAIEFATVCSLVAQRSP